MRPLQAAPARRRWCTHSGLMFVTFDSRDRACDEAPVRCEREHRKGE
jgi:hypothetical protein